ncbi:MAG: RdgB/HAM1 family non-canonical purine NTP pyrophosphatase [Pseudanabaenaceae cyanobacterium]|jgi:XTP/dITP diphosphohydrolase
MVNSSVTLQRLMIASGNAGKIAEFQEYLADLGVELLAKPQDLDIDETGTTFLANAHLKASQVALATGEWALADDSGLEVMALNGAPGVLSARYAATDAERIARILTELDGNPHRAAQFVCAIAIAGPDGTIAAEAVGICTGEITDAPRGKQGFGYDPIFAPSSHAPLTFGEIAPEVKGEISHRAKALAILRPQLANLTGRMS